MISTREQGQAIAIAAVTQSVEVAFDLARSLSLPETTLTCLTESLFQISAETPKAFTTRAINSSWAFAGVAKG